MTVTDHLSAQELQQWGRQQCDGRVVRRAQVVVLAQKRHTGARIAELTGFSPRSVRRIVQCYNEQGPEGLGDQPRPSIQTNALKCGSRTKHVSANKAR